MKGSTTRFLAYKSNCLYSFQSDEAMMRINIKHCYPFVVWVCPLLLLLAGSPGCYLNHSDQAGNDFSINIVDADNSFLQVEFSINNYRIKEIVEAGEKFSDIVFNGNVRLKKRGYAALPYLHTSVQIPTAGQVEYRIVSEQHVDIPLGYPFLPSKGALHKSEDASTVQRIIDPQSVKSEFYPAEIVRQSEPYIFRDVTGINLYVHPFQYHAQDRILRVFTKIRVALNINNDLGIEGSRLSPSRSIVREMSPIYKSLFINYGSAGANSRGYSSFDQTVGDFGEILVIYTDRDSTAINPYVEWKRQMGYKVHTKVVPVGSSVRNIIKDEYSANKNILYVQLVGDWDDIKSELGTTNSISNRAADPILGCVSGNDYYPELIVGRFSANQAEHITTQVNKTINYEKNPDPSGSWYKKHLCISTSENVIFDDEREDGINHSEVIAYDKLEKFTYTDTYFFTDKDSTNSTKNAINSGVGVINYWGHGSLSGFETTSFYKSNVNQLSNGNKLPFIFAGACDIGWFNNNTVSFAEVWLRKSGGGAVAAMMASMSQWYDAPARGQDYMNDLLVGGYDYSANPGKGISTNEGRTTFGSIAFNALILMYTEDSSRESLETLETWIVFGDASLQVRTDTPQPIEISNSNVACGEAFETRVTSNGSGVKAARVTLSQGESVYTAMTDNNGNVSIEHPFTAGSVNLVVTGFNLDTIFKNVDIGTSQNEPPSADFAFTVNELQVQFTDQSQDPENNISNWAWDFGDGSASSAKDPAHTYANPGNFVVKLKVTDQGGLVDEVTKSITVSNTSYHLTVENGDGDGSYAMGQNVTITADQAPSGKIFKKWETDSENVFIAEPSQSTTSLTMPSNDVVVSATYGDETIVGCGSIPGQMSSRSSLFVCLLIIMLFFRRSIVQGNKTKTANTTR